MVLWEEDAQAAGCVQGAWMNDRASSGDGQVVTKELQELQADRTENPASVL